MSNIEERAKAVAEPFLKEQGCRLWDVIFEKEGAMRYLKILFDDGENGEKPLDIDRCEQLTPPLNRILDAEEFIKDVDVVEIGSPGLTRRLRRPEHFAACIGRQVKVMRRNGGKTETFTETLNGFDEDAKSVTAGAEEIPLKNIVRISLEEQEV